MRDDWTTIAEPTLVLDAARARRNLRRMTDKAAAAGVQFRPHFKTHQSADIGEWFRRAGVDAITVSSAGMADYFTDHGWTDITLALPVNLRELSRLDALAERIALGVLVDAPEVIAPLSDGLHHPVRVWLKIDTGYGRVGVWWRDRQRCLEIVARLAEAPRLRFAGLLTHSGHTYRAADAAAVAAIHAETVDRLQVVQEYLTTAGLPAGALSIGDTPSCSVLDRFPGIDEIRPGNFIFHDLMMAALGVCGTEDIAVAVACPVVGIYPARGELVVYGGAVHLGKECLRGDDGSPVYGHLTRPDAGSLGELDRRAVVRDLSQEHGVIRAPDAWLRRLAVGDLVWVVPVHSCLTADRFTGYLTLDGAWLPRR